MGSGVAAEVVLLAGGTGGAKLAAGMQAVVGRRLTVIALTRPDPIGRAVSEGAGGRLARPSAFHVIPCSLKRSSSCGLFG